MKIMLRIIMLQLNRPLFTTSRLTPGNLALLAFSFAVLGILAGCEYDLDDLDSGSEMALHMNEAETNLDKKGNNLMPAAAQMLVTGLQGASGSTVGPGGALYVTEGAIGQISRVDPRTGDVTTFASGLPPSLVGIGGAFDVAFLGGTAYVLVTLVGPDVGGSDVVGIYRIDGPNSFTVIADIGQFNLDNERDDIDFFVPTGVQYSIQTYRGGFLVADGHLNRVLHVTKDGVITIFKTFGNIVPTGLALQGNTVYMAQAGAVPHLPEDGKVVSFGANSGSVTTVATGARLIVDVEINRGGGLYALSQGIWDGVGEGTPALPATGSLVKVNEDGTFTVIADELDRPTSMEFIRNTAFIITLTGEIITIENVDNPPYGI